jgi:double zinc ribbon protein
MLELIVGFLFAAGAAYYVLRPILDPPAPDAAPVDGAEGDDPDDDLSAQAVAVRALKEIEFDRATGKLSDADYDALKAKYTAAALAALRGDAATRDAPAPAAQRAPAVAGAPRAAACPVDGPRPEPDAVFCSACGRRLGEARGYCVRCGSALETDARYCNRCGARVAA